MKGRGKWRGTAGESRGCAPSASRMQAQDHCGFGTETDRGTDGKRHQCS